MRLIWLLGLVGCIQAAKLPGENAALQAQIEEINKDKWAKECAPRETALALSHADFVQLEFKQGDARRATEHMETARSNAASAMALSAHVSA